MSETSKQTRKYLHLRSREQIILNQFQIILREYFKCCLISAMSCKCNEPGPSGRTQSSATSAMDKRYIGEGPKKYIWKFKQAVVLFLLKKKRKNHYSNSAAVM